MGFRPAFKRRLSDIAWIIYCPFFVCKPCYTTETLGKELGKDLGKERRTLCKGFTYKNFTYTPVHWDKCQTISRKSMFVANHTIVDWGPHGMWLSDCSDDINNTVCDMEGHWHYNGTLLWQKTSWVAWPWVSPNSSLINRVGLNNGTFGNLLQAPAWKNLELGPGHFIGTSRGHSNYFFRYNQSYFIQAWVPLPFVIAIENLQFNKTFTFCNLY